jgi:hypothetical protein
MASLTAATLLHWRVADPPRPKAKTTNRQAFNELGKNHDGVRQRDIKPAAHS